MKNIVGLFILIFLFCLNLNAQKATFLTSGKINFERKDNVYYCLSMLLKDEQGNWVEDYLDRYKKPENHFATTNWILYFDKNITNYMSDPDIINKDATPYFISANVENTVYMDLQNKQQIRNAHLFENGYLLKDSIQNIKWKLTSETKEIAGIICKRANALIMDSIYVVAFYTDQIPTQGGPEIFNGLPGMILGVALPYDHISWFATKITVLTPSKEDLKYPQKGKIFTTKEMVADLMDPLKNRGNTARNLILKNLQL
ncbi:GLPGLI family protein [Rhizosphaericola mali]|uniref:GLPGLI family protein n=1 Tax=Rhizosphaericola mali TaxID=2545455 RepID=A0A5P2G4J7_9BACT|nr:GLPGLI family protein [Rhizosphaericola mali]QES90445.1 GLPGLI family protein [Rhizosphaericola mali]